MVSESLGTPLNVVFRGKSRVLWAEPLQVVTRMARHIGDQGVIMPSRPYCCLRDVYYVGMLLPISMTAETSYLAKTYGRPSASFTQPRLSC